MKVTYTMYSAKVRQLCIDENYYTRGDNKDYKHMLFTLCKGKTLRAVEKVAEDIIKHSDVAELKIRYSGHDINDIKKIIMMDIINECAYVSVE